MQTMSLHSSSSHPFLFLQPGNESESGPFVLYLLFIAVGALLFFSLLSSLWWHVCPSTGQVLFHSGLFCANFVCPFNIAYKGTFKTPGNQLLFVAKENYLPERKRNASGWTCRFCRETVGRILLRCYIFGQYTTIPTELRCGEQKQNHLACNRASLSFLFLWE